MSVYICDKCPGSFTKDHTLPHSFRGEICDGTPQKFYTADEYDAVKEELDKLKGLPIAPCESSS